jgi:hypothetical protein
MRFVSTSSEVYRIWGARCPAFLSEMWACRHRILVDK